jgi:hypothetical protein
MGSMIRCNVCGAVLHSMSRHDFQKCSCENEAFVDGGFDYMRAGAVDLSKIDVISHTHEDGLVIINDES